MSESCEQRIGEHLEHAVRRFGILTTLIDAGVSDQDDLDRLDIDELEELCEALELHPTVEEDSVLLDEDEDEEEAWRMLAVEQIAALVDDEYMWPDTAHEVLLDVSKKIHFDVQLSTGGPAAGFDVEVNDQGTIVDIEYYFVDWGDGARRSLRGASFDAVERALLHIVSFGD